MIDRGDIRQAIDRCSNIWASLPGAGYGRFGMGWQPDCKIQRSGRNGQRDWCMSRVTAIISALVICIIVCLSWAVNHYRDNAVPTNPARKNARELEAGERGNYWLALQMRQRDVAALDAKYTKELADIKLKMMLCVMMCRWSSSVCTSKRSVSQCVKLPASGVDKPPPTGRHRWTGLFRPQRLITMQKQLEGTRSILMSSADRVAHIDGQLMQLLWAIHTRFQRSINA